MTVDYSSYINSVKDPLSSVLQGVQIGSGISQMRDQREKSRLRNAAYEAKKAEDEAYEIDAQALFDKIDSEEDITEDFIKLGIKYPKYGDVIGQGYKDWAARRVAKQEEEQAEKYNKGLIELSNKIKDKTATSEDIVSFSAANPKMADHFDKIYSNFSDAKKENAKKESIWMLTALESGDKDLVIKALDEKIEAFGDDQQAEKTGFEAMRRTLVNGDTEKVGQTVLALQLNSLMGDKDFAETWDTIQERQGEIEQRPLKMEKLALDLDLEESEIEKNWADISSTYAGVKKTRAETKKTRAETDKLGAETKKTRAETDKLGAETKKTRAETDKLGAETKKTWADISSIYAGVKKTRAEADKLGAETKKTLIELEAMQKGQIPRDPEKLMKAEGDLRKEYNKNTEDFTKVQESYNKILAVTEDSSPAGDIALIFNYMKMLDPNSVVRESEYATAESAGNVPTRLVATYNKLLTEEGRLDAKQRQDFIKQSSKLWDAASKREEDVRNGLSRIGKKYGLDTSNIFYTEGVEKPGTEEEKPEEAQDVVANINEKYSSPTAK